MVSRSSRTRRAKDSDRSFCLKMYDRIHDKREYESHIYCSRVEIFLRMSWFLYILHWEYFYSDWQTSSIVIISISFDSPCYRIAEKPSRFPLRTSKTTYCTFPCIITVVIHHCAFPTNRIPISNVIWMKHQSMQVQVHVDVFGVTNTTCEMAKDGACAV